MKLFALIGAVFLSVALGACGGEDASNGAGRPEGPATTTAALLKPKPKPVLTPPKGPPPKGMVVKDLKLGTGAAADAGDELTAEYAGFNYVNREEFTSHAHVWGKGEPLVFELGSGEVIRGIDRGLVGIKVGGRRELTIPPDLAYGDVQPPPEVGPGETVIYVVELLGLSR